MKLTKRQIIVLASLVVVFTGLITGVVLLYPKTKKESPKKPIEAKVEVKKEISIEVYTKMPSIEDFTEEEGKLDLANVPSEDSVCPEEETDCVVEKLATTVGEYEVVIAIKEKEYKSTLKVIDSTMPTLKTKDVSITEGETYTVDSFIEKKSDNSKKEVKAYFEEEAMASLTEVKEHTVKITVEDESGNKTTNEAKLTIKKKEEVKTSSSSSSKPTTSSSNNNSSANNNYQYSDNIVVQRALSLVGKTGMVCDDVVEYAIKGLGKEYITYHEVTDRWCSNNAGTTLGVDDPAMYSDHSWESTPKIIVNGYTLYKYYSNNNILYKVEGYKDGVWEDVSNTFPSVGQAAYSNCGGMTYSNPVLIFSTDQVMQVSLNSIQPGDILKYANGGNGTGHVAIYIGDGKAVHGGIGQSNDVQIMTMYPPGASTPVAYRIK